MAADESRTASPVTHREGPATAKRAQVQAEVLRATEQLLAEGSSYADLNVERIATAAGISRTAFYFYFRDKRDLLMRLAGDVTELLYAQADIWFSGEGDDPEQEIREALTRIAELYREHGVLIRAIVEVSTYEEDIATFWRGLLSRFVDATARRIEIEDQLPDGTVLPHGLRADLDGRAHLLPAARPGRAPAPGRDGRGGRPDLPRHRVRAAVDLTGP